MNRSQISLYPFIQSFDCFFVVVFGLCAWTLWPRLVFNLWTILLPRPPEIIGVYRHA